MQASTRNQHHHQFLRKAKQDSKKARGDQHTVQEGLQLQACSDCQAGEQRPQHQRS